MRRPQYPCGATRQPSEEPAGTVCPWTPQPQRTMGSAHVSPVEAGRLILDVSRRPEPDLTTRCCPLIRSRWQTAAIAAAGISSLAALTLHGYLGTYSRYIADDFCSAGMARRLGVLRAVWYWYINWTGRYSASALDAVFGLLGPAVTPFVTGLVLLIWLASLHRQSWYCLDNTAAAGSLMPPLSPASLYMSR